MISLYVNLHLHNSCHTYIFKQAVFSRGKKCTNRATMWRVCPVHTHSYSATQRPVKSSSWTKTALQKQAPAISEYQRIIQKPLTIFSPDKDKCKAQYTCYGSEGGTERNFALKAWNRA